MHDKQAHPRIKRRIMVRYGAGGSEHTGFTMNLSLTGAFIRTNNVFRPGTAIHTEFQFRDSKFSHLARVVWAKKVPVSLAHVVPCGMGVRFLNPGSEWEEFFQSWHRSEGA